MMRSTVRLTVITALLLIQSGFSQIYHIDISGTIDMGLPPTSNG